MTYIETAEDRLTLAQTTSDYDAYYNETGLADLDVAEDLYRRYLGQEWEHLVKDTEYPDYM